MLFKSLKDHIYDYLTVQISEGKLKADMKINENEICEELGVSRTPLREALLKLENDGLLEKLPRKGFKVKKLSEKSAKDKYTIIGALDGLAATLSLPNLSKSDYFEMEMIIRKIDLVLEEDDFAQYISLQNDFHNVYLYKCGNQELIDLLAKLKMGFMNKTYFEKFEKEEAIRILMKTNQEHKVIIKLMTKGETEELDRYMRYVHWHLDNSLYEL